MQWRHVFKNQQRWDWHLVMFFLNVFAVVYGYGLRGEAFQAAKVLRVGLVMVSLGSILWTGRNKKYLFDRHKSWVLYIFLLLYFLVSPFSVDFIRSLQRLIAWIPFLIYINYFIIYLFENYSKDEAKIKLLQIFSLAYFFPVLIMLSNGVAFQTENAYGQSISNYKTNVLSWACTVFVILSFDLYTNYKMPTWLKYTFFATGVVTLWAIVLMGSRSSYASLGLSTMIVIWRSKISSIYLKGAIGVCIAGFAYYIITSPNSVVNLRSEYATIRNQRKEVRLELAEHAFQIFENNPRVFFTGFGFDNFQAGLQYYAGVQTELASHNSYLEILFSGGGITFVFFLCFFVFNAAIKYYRFDSQYFIFMPPFLIIPYFESNLNAGQFLFFPWMTFLFYYLHASSNQYTLQQNAYEEPLKEAHR